MVKRMFIRKTTTELTLSFFRFVWLLKAVIRFLYVLWLKQLRGDYDIKLQSFR